MAVTLKRSTLSVIHNSNGNGPIVVKSAKFPRIEDPHSHLKKSLQETKRVSIALLRAATHTIPVRRAIDRIAHGVLAMPRFVTPPKDLVEDENAIAHAETLLQALQKPNRDEHNTYSKLVRAVITDMLVLGFAAIERQEGSKDTQPFWLWAANPENIRLNPEWRADKEGIVPRFYDYGQVEGLQEPVPLLNKHLFLIQSQASTYEFVPPSPLEVAFPFLMAWMSLGNFQARTTGRAQNEFIIDLGDITQEQLDAFRDYWENEVVGKGITPLVAGKGQLKIEKLGASNDQGLYLGFTDYLLRGIALSFGLTPRDMGMTEHDNRATAGAAADAAFQDAILPIALTIQEHLDQEVIDYYSSGYRLEYSDTEPRTEQQEAETAGNLFERKIITRNEARRRVGEKTLGQEGEIFFDGATADEAQKEEENQKLLPSSEAATEKSSKNSNVSVNEESDSNLASDKVTNKSILNIQQRKPKKGKAEAAKAIAATKLPTIKQLSLF